MAIFAMDLPDKFFISIILTEKSVQSALIKITPQGIEVVRKSGEFDYQDDAACVVKTDECLQELGKESENVNDVIFGLEPSWVTGSELVDRKKPLLKKITDELSLSATGFVVITEAIVQALLETHAQASGILVNATLDTIGVSFIRQGKIVQTEHVGRSGDVIADVTEGLARIKEKDAQAQPFPAKFFLFSLDLVEEEVIAAEQSLIEHNWQGGKWMLQQPVVEMLPAKGLVEAVAKQGGKAVALAQGLLPPVKAESEDFGFDEVNFQSQPPQYDNLQPVNLNQESSAKSFGIPVKNDDVERAVPDGFAATPPPTDATSKAPDMNHQAVPLKMASALKLPKFGPLPSFKSLFKMAQAGESKMAHHPFIAAGFLLGLLTLLGVGYFYLKSTAKAIVTIELKSVSVAKEALVTLDPRASSVDTAQLILPAELVTKTAEGEETTPTTGIKLVGEKAKGKVTLFNKTTSSKTFSAGSALSSGKYQFTLDSEVTIASASVTTNGGGETKTYGKAETTVTAGAIGSESNLAKDTELKIASFDPGTYSASALEAFSGGSSREVRVVAEVDRQTVLTQLKKKLVEQAEAGFKQDSGNGTYTVPTGSLEVTQATYDAKVGEETEQLTLKVTAAVQGVKYKSEDLAPLAQAILGSQIPSGYALANREPEILSSPTEAASRSAQVKLQLNLSSVAQPVIAADVWQKEIAHLSLATAEQKLKAKPEVTAVTLQILPKIAQTILRALPAADKIQIIFK